MASTASLTPRLSYSPKKKSIDWLIFRLRNLELTIAQEEYERMEILIDIEENERWKESAKYKKSTWKEFLSAVCPRFGTATYNGAKKLIREQGAAVYRFYGHQRATVIQKHAPYQQQVINAGKKFFEKNGRIPTPTTLDNIAAKISGIHRRPRISEVIDTEASWRERCKEAETECKKLKKENHALLIANGKLKKEVERLHKKLERDFQLKLEKLAKLGKRKRK
jgi:hypothetical protein